MTTLIMAEKETTSSLAVINSNQHKILLFYRISGHHAPVLVDELSVARFCSQPTRTARNLL